ncbi:MAG: TVP38/TMEM64 family protein [Methylococcaceae bacterium]|nr:TVP38/TMEM64 family protein [Methylococcaceae bacterium]
MTEIPATFPPEAPSKSTGIVSGTVFLAVIALGAVAYLTPLRTWLAEGELIKQELTQLGIWAPLVFTIAAALLTAIGMPRLLLCSLGGLAFGFASGLLWTEVATVLGSYATFVFVRQRGSDYALTRFPRLQGFSRQLETKGIMAVILLRQLPMNGFYNNVFLGLTPVSHRDFLIGSLVGYLPLGLTACLIGAGLLQPDFSKSMQYLLLALVLSLGLGFLLRQLIRRRQAG